MNDFNYAHKDTSDGERQTETARFNKPRISESLQAIRAEAFRREIPVSDDETLCLLQTLVCSKQPEKILELGTAVGVSGIAMLGACPTAHLTTVERDAGFYAEAQKNFVEAGVTDRVTQIFGDAGEIIDALDGEFDFVFLDCAKVQYIKYLPRLKELLKKGGILYADDVLLFGYVTGEVETPKKRRALVAHVKEYIDAVCNDEELFTTVLDVGNGAAISVKR
ncbi:MAG: O-methyltransferase [Clostridia bacterium]|nr:O-methyltransferase [Clostridia bacterium]